MLDSKDGSIQYVTDNFDAQICSQNGIKQTHGLASIVTQPMSEEAPGSINIPRVAKTKLTDLQIDETNKKLLSESDILKFQKFMFQVGYYP